MTEDSKVEYRFPYDVKGFSGVRYWWNDKGVWQFDHDQACHICLDEEELQETCPECSRPYTDYLRIDQITDKDTCEAFFTQLINRLKKHGLVTDD